jgi:NLR family CARD domain-containing protein 3
VEDATIDSALVQKMLKDLKERPDLTKFTLENNTIKDFDGMCQVFLHLKNYDKLEAINFRLNNFNDKIIEALAEGIKMKKELRVRSIYSNVLIL